MTLGTAAAIRYLKINPWRRPAVRRNACRVPLCRLCRRAGLALCLGKCRILPLCRRAALALCLCLLLSACGSSWQDRLAEGQKRMEREEYAEAAVLFGAVSEDGHAEGFLWRGDAYAALAQSGSSGEARALYFADALADYRAAASMLGGETSPEVLPRLTALFLAMGDEALSLSDFDGAEGYYNAVLERNHADADAYGRLADVSLARGRTTEAAARLERGVTATHDQRLAKRLEDLRAVFDEVEVQTRRLAAAQALKDVPYFGDETACGMGPEQALAYARLLSDGINGKFPGFSGYGRPLYQGNVYWDEPYAVLGMGSYETDRALAVLGDFAGDGNPFLYVFSSVVGERSFEVFGWKDGEVVRAAGVEAYGSQREGRLAVTARGTVVLEESEPTGERSRSGRTIRFYDGGTGVAGVQDETWDPSEEAVRVTTNGVPSTYSEEEWRNREGLSTAPLDNVAGRALYLRDMIAALNSYAAALGGTEGAVEVPPEHSDRHKMATAMLRKLFALNRLSIDETGARLCDTRLLDLDRDGQEELFTAFQGTYQAEGDVSCQYALYRWTGEELAEYPGAAQCDELHLARYGDEYGILGAGRDPDLPLSQSLTEQDTSDPSAGTAAVPQTETETGGEASQTETSAETGQRTENGDNQQTESSSSETENTEDSQTANQNSQMENQTANQASQTENQTTARSRSTAEPYTLKYAYTFLSHSEEIIMEAEGDRRAYHVVRSGRQADIAEREFAAIRDRYTVLQTLMNYRTSDLENRNYTPVITALYRIQAEG
ncbi:MAG: hypothetical protein IJT94_11710 [Oscillibacter sp.]|nr:hypothetical protein [Oscillibacter sp.]